MYKVDVDDVNKKLAKLRKRPANIFMVTISILMLFTAFMNDAEADYYLAIGIILLVSSAKYYFIDPLLGKIELLENDINKLKAKVGIEDEQHF